MLLTDAQKNSVEQEKQYKTKRHREHNILLFHGSIFQE